MKNSILFLKSRIFFKQILWAMITLLILVIICMQWLSGNTNHGDYIVVPDLAKKDLIEVANLLQDKSLRFQVIDSANYRGDFPRNSVISQKPAAGSQVKANKKIYLQLNASGYSNISLPQLIQVTQRNATSKLQAVGLKVAKITYIDALGKDMVYGVKYRDKWINAGYKLPKMSEIELICGNGTRPNLDSTNVIIEFP
ncbi:MAG: beta-lactam-binding protein with PASTA domain [Arcticibacterium sp.]|jgi:beta-lactam-binding protein with PASTA domain